MRSILCFALFASGLFACGVGTSQSLREDAGPDPQGDDAGIADAGCGPVPQLTCPTACGGPVLECVSGAWQCANHVGTNCPVDAGCSGPPPGCPIYCAGQGAEPVCIGNNQWTCSYTACVEDAEAPDAWIWPVDANPGQPFACGDLACDPATSYCELVAGGPILYDGSTQAAYSCNPLPSGCVAGAATCDCIQGVQGPGCGCVAANGKVIETCELP